MRRCGDQRAPAVVVRTVELCPALWGGPREVGEASGSEYCKNGGEISGESCGTGRSQILKHCYHIRTHTRKKRASNSDQ